VNQSSASEVIRHTCAIQSRLLLLLLSLLFKTKTHIVGKLLLVSVAETGCCCTSGSRKRFSARAGSRRSTGTSCSCCPASAEDYSLNGRRQCKSEAEPDLRNIL